MRYVNLIILVSTAALAACSAGSSSSPSSSSSDGASGVGRGKIEMGAATTPAFATASDAKATRLDLGRSAGAPPSARIPTSSTKAAAIHASLAGTPALGALVGSNYHFAPSFTVAPVEPLTFAIANCPSWATFNPVTGALSGTPSAQDVGTYSMISISAIADNGRVESLPSFSIAVMEAAAGSATLTWEAPLQKTDGTDLTDLAGFRIYYGTDPSSLDQSVDVEGTNLSAYTVRNLLPGTWYFEVQAYSGSNVGSASTMVTKEVM